MTIVSDLWVAGPVGGNWNATGIWLDNSNGVQRPRLLGLRARDRHPCGRDLRRLAAPPRFELNQHGFPAAHVELGWASGNLRLLDCYGYQNYQAGITLTNCRGVQVHSCSATGSAHAILARHCATDDPGCSGEFRRLSLAPLRHPPGGLRARHRCRQRRRGNGPVRHRPSGLPALYATGNVVRNTTDGPRVLSRNARPAGLREQCQPIGGGRNAGFRLPPSHDHG